MDCKLKILTFGGLSIRIGEKPVTGLASRKAELLLVYLARQARPYAREVLAELLWEGRSKSQAQANLRVVLSSLRRNLGDYLDIDRQRAGILLGADIWLDASILEQAIEPLPGAPDPITAVHFNELKTAVKLYQGEFLEGIFVQDAPALDAWMDQERQRLEVLLCQGLRLLAENCLQSGDYQEGITYANRLVELEPLVEAGQRQLIKLMAQSGQRAAAVRHGERLKLYPVQELGIE
ncbi:MAG: AfsR/SARP family transcriptional regulator, partial [Anaerolineales bacterium]